MKKILTVLVLLLFWGYSDNNAHAAAKDTSVEPLENVLVETVEDSNSITPFSSIKPVLQNPGLGGGTSFGTAMSIGGRTMNHSSTSSVNNLPTTSTKLSSKDLIQNGAIKQRRYYDADGNAKQDIDYFHSGVNHEFPHLHYFNWANSVPSRTGSYPAQF